MLEQALAPYPLADYTNWPKISLIKFGVSIDELAFTKEQAMELIAWLESIDGTVKTIVVHCRKGQSRSAAVAKYLCGRYGLPFDPYYRKFNQHVLEVLLNSQTRSDLPPIPVPI